MLWAAARQVSRAESGGTGSGNHGSRAGVPAAAAN